MRKPIAEVRIDAEKDLAVITYMDGTETQMAAHVWGIRLGTIKSGMEWEIQFPGGKLTAKAPSCFTIAREEFGIRGRDKIKKYKEFCQQFGFEPNRRIVGDG